jgi:hypothetical protein
VVLLFVRQRVFQFAFAFFWGEMGFVDFCG